jgi:hypothetical protein
MRGENPFARLVEDFTALPLGVSAGEISASSSSIRRLLGCRRQPASSLSPRRVAVRGPWAELRLDDQENGGEAETLADGGPDPASKGRSPSISDAPRVFCGRRGSVLVRRARTYLFYPATGRAGHTFVAAPYQDRDRRRAAARPGNRSIGQPQDPSDSGRGRERRGRLS